MCVYVCVIGRVREKLQNLPFSKVELDTHAHTRSHREKEREKRKKREKKRKKSHLSFHTLNGIDDDGHRAFVQRLKTLWRSLRWATAMAQWRRRWRSGKYKCWCRPVSVVDCVLKRWWGDGVEEDLLRVDIDTRQPATEARVRVVPAHHHLRPKIGAIESAIESFEAA